MHGVRDLHVLPSCGGHSDSLVRVPPPKKLSAIAQTWLVESARRQLTPHRYWSGYKPEYVRELEAIIIHYTATRDFARTAKWLTLAGATSPASAHFLIDRDGKVVQLAPLEDRTWHAGGTSSKLYTRGNVNGRTLGIELMNLGPLKATTDSKGRTTFIAEADAKPWNDTGVSALDGGFWEPFPTPQVDALVLLLDQIYERHPSLREKSRLVGHQDVDPTRKRDPGPAFPWAVVRDRLAL